MIVYVYTRTRACTLPHSAGQRGRKLEFGNWNMEIGNWKLEMDMEIGNWKLESGNGKWNGTYRPP